MNKLSLLVDIVNKQVEEEKEKERLLQEEQKRKAEEEEQKRKVLYTDCHTTIT